jgi:hypothetical protein
MEMLVREVTYLGGIARFRLPDSWIVEEDAESGGCFYDPERDGTLRLNVLTFDAPAGELPPALQLPRRSVERHIGGTAPAGCDIEVYETDAVENDEPLRIRYWRIVQRLPRQFRVYVFSYAYPTFAKDAAAADIAMLDREIGQMIPSGQQH